MDHKINILLISSHFPPENSGGTSRPYSLFKYLPGFGVNVFVITKKKPAQPGNEANIFRFDSFINWRSQHIFSFKRWYRYYTLFGFKLFHMHADTFWYKSVLKNIDCIIKEHNIHLIYATYPETESLQIGVRLKKKYKIPLLLEFRDGLVFEPVKMNANRIQKKQILNLEKQSVNNAAGIITIGENLSNYFKQMYQVNVDTVYNGYDSDDFIEADATEFFQGSKIKVVHFGGLNASRSSNRNNLFLALKKLLDDNKINNTNFELHFIGNITEKEKMLAQQSGLNDLIIFTPQMEKSAGFCKIKQEFNYVLFYGVKDNTTIISSKLPEYMRLGKPVLGICKGNEAEDIIRKSGIGEVCDFDVQSIYDLFSNAMNQKITFNPDIEFIKLFDRKKQAAQISVIIKRIIYGS